MTKATKEDRLVRETELIGHIASNLKFLYISDEDYFKQQLTINIREQQRILHHEGIKSKYFYITEGEVIPFSIDNNEIPQIPQHLLDTMTTMDNITHHVRDEFEQMSLKTKGNLDIAHKANTSITELMEGIVKVSEQLRGIQSELKEVEGILPELESVSEHFSPVSQETLASTDEMLTSSEQQVQQIEKTHQVGLKLRDLSMKLKKEIERFTISS